MTNGCHKENTSKKKVSTKKRKKPPAATGPRKVWAKAVLGRNA